MDKPSSSDVFKIPEAAQYLGVTRRWIYRRIWNGDLPASKVGGLYFIHRRDIDALIEQGRANQQSGTKQTEGESLKCGYCFRLLESDAMIGGVCRAEDCERLLCTQCLAEGHLYCAAHVPNRETLWEEALAEFQQGNLPVLVRASQARLRELNFLGRFQTRLSQIETLRHPLTDETLSIVNWEQNLESGDERAAVMRLMNKVVLEADWLNKIPLNAYLRYNLPPQRKQRGLAVSILARSLSPLEEMIQKGFSSRALGADDLSPALASLGEAAQRGGVTLALLGATTGWDQAAADLIQNENAGAAFAHHSLLVYLYDMETRRLVYHSADPRLVIYAEVFSPILPSERIEEIVRAVEREMGFYESLTATQVTQTYPYPANLVRKAFELMAASGQYTLMELPDLGPAIVRS